MVFDNIDNPKLDGNGMKDPSGYDIRSYFPEAHQGHILITTRSSRLEIGKVISIEKLLNSQESMAILASTSRRRILDQDPHARNLLNELDGLPLALATAGAYLSQVSTSLEDYLCFYRSSWLKLQETSPGLLSYENRALYSTWNLSFEHIQNQNKSAGKLLRLWAYFDNQDLWFQLLAAGSEDSPEWFSTIISDQLNFDKIIRLLCDHALVERITDSDGYSMHTCVYAWAVHVLNAERKISMTRLALTCVGFSVPREDVDEYSLIGRRLLPHARKCLEFFSHSIDFEFRDNPRILDAVHEIGFLCKSQGKIKEDKAMYQRALKGKEKAWGPEHPSTLNTVNNLGILYAGLGKIQEAEAMYQRALKGYEKAWGPEHPSTLRTVNSLGNLYADLGKIKEAEAMYQRALKGKEKAWGPEHPSTLRTVKNMGNLYADLGKIKEAEAMYQQALKGFEKAWGPKHPSTLNTVDSLGILYADQGKIQEAEAMYQRVLKGYEKAWGPEHPSTLDTVNNLGNLYADLGKIKEAEAMYQRALKGYEKAWGPEHPSTLDTVNNLGKLYADLGKIKEAEAMYQRALKGKEKVWGQEHTSTLRTVNNLGNLYADLGKIKEAEAMFQRALKGFEEALGSEHRLTLKVVHNMRILYEN
ncbi:hypothetical protein MMC29_001091 [Sticta canariensis]|nr:hypothetical protein [Sticta canariensis]